MARCFDQIRGTNVKTHFSEADLLETYYMEPGESLEIMMHLAGCSECATRYEQLERKLRDAAACETHRPEPFWTRQRMSIMHRVQRGGASFAAGRSLRIAAAALLTFLLGGVAVYETLAPHRGGQPVVQATAAPAPQPASVEPQPQPVAHDAWQADELKDFHGVVDWESWVDSRDGGQL